jgi:hypothetical protein
MHPVPILHEERNMYSPFTSSQLAERAVYRRAVEAINWGMPAVNFDLMLQAMIGSVRGKPDQIVECSGLPDWKLQTLTANLGVIYLNLSSTTPGMPDRWCRLPAPSWMPGGRVDRGKGGK